MPGLAYSPDHGKVLESLLNLTVMPFILDAIIN